MMLERVLFQVDVLLLGIVDSVTSGAWMIVSDRESSAPSSHDSSLAAQSQSHTEQGPIFSNQMERPKKLKEKAILSRK